MKTILLLLISVAAMCGQVITPGGVTRSHVSPTTIACTAGSATPGAYVYSNGGTDQLFTCGPSGFYIESPGGSTSTLAASGVGASGAAGANKLVGPASSFITTDSSGNGAGITPSAAAAILPISGTGTYPSGTVSNAPIVTTAPYAGISPPQRTGNAKLYDINAVKDCGAAGNDSTDDTAALIACVTYASTLPMSGAPIELYLPSGIYKLTAPWRIPGWLHVYGAGAQSTIIKQYTNSANAVTAVGVASTGDPAICGFECSGSLENLSITSAGGYLHTGTLLENLVLAGYTIKNVTLYNSGGRGYNNQNAERTHVDNLKINAVRWPLIHNSNEAVYTNLDINSPGATQDGYCFNVNCIAGTYPSSGPVLPDTHGAFWMEGASVHVKKYSIKSTFYLPAFQVFSAENSVIEDGYTEGEPGFVSSLSLNSDLYAGGKSPEMVATSALGTSATTLTVSDSSWVPNYIGQVQDLSVLGIDGSGRYVLFPPDFNPDTHILSSICTGGCTTIFTDTYEIAFGVFTGDTNQFNFTQRGLVSTTAQNWPSGFHMERQPVAFHGPLVLASGHLDSLHQIGSPSVTANCNSLTYQSCQSIEAGFMPDTWIQTSGGTTGAWTAPPVIFTPQKLSMYSSSISYQGLIYVHNSAFVDVSGFGLGGVDLSASLNAGTTSIAELGGTFIQKATYSSGTSSLIATSNTFGKYILSTTSQNAYFKANTIYGQSYRSNSGILGNLNGIQFLENYCVYGVQATNQANNQDCADDPTTSTVGSRSGWHWNGSLWASYYRLGSDAASIQPSNGTLSLDNGLTGGSKAGTLNLGDGSITKAAGSNMTFSGTIQTPHLTTGIIEDSGLTSGNCVQASTGGLLTTTSSPCGSGSSYAGTGTATFAPQAGAGTGATAVCATSHVCDSFSGEVTLTSGSVGTPATGSQLIITLPVTRANLPNCSVDVYGGSTFLGASKTVTTSTITISSGVALTFATAYTVDYVCGGQ